MGDTPQNAALSEEELAKKYSAKAQPAVTPNEDALISKYSGKTTTEAKPTTADNEVERAAPPANLGFTPSNVWKNLKGAATSTVDFGKDVLFPQGNTEGERLGYLENKYIKQPHEAAMKKGVDALNAGHPVEAAGHAFASEIPIIGPFAESLGEQAGKGDIGGAMTQAGAAYAGGKLIGKAGELTSDAISKGAPAVGKAAGRVAAGENPVTVGRNAVGDVLRDPATGELKEIPKNVARVGGATIGAKLGAASGIPEGGYIGATAGGLYAPSLLERAFPESASRAAGRVPSPVSSEPWSLMPEPARVEPGVQDTLHFGKAPKSGANGTNLISSDPFKLENPTVPRETAVQQQLEIPQAEKPRTSKQALQTIGELIDQQSGVKPLDRTLPLREQADIKKPLGNRVGMDLRANSGEQMTAPEKLATGPQNEVGRQMGAPPLRENVPLRQQLKPDTGGEPVKSKQELLEERYPDRGIRQMVHSNGARIVDAAGDGENPEETLKAVHDLKNADIRQAMINSGEDMGQVSIGNRKATGNQMTRQEALEKLLDKGHTPAEIVRLAHAEMSNK